MPNAANYVSSATERPSSRLGERQKKICPWGKLAACLLLHIRKLEAYATVRYQLPLALTGQPTVGGA